MASKRAADDDTWVTQWDVNNNRGAYCTTVSHTNTERRSPGLRFPLEQALSPPLRVGAEMVGQLTTNLLHRSQRVALLSNIQRDTLTQTINSVTDRPKCYQRYQKCAYNDQIRLKSFTVMLIYQSNKLVRVRINVTFIRLPQGKQLMCVRLWNLADCYSVSNKELIKQVIWWRILLAR